MSQGLETPAPQTCVVASNVVPLGHAANLEKSDSCSFAVAARLVGFASGRVQDGSEQWFQSFLAQLGPGESLSLRVAFDESGGISFGATACAPQPAIAARVHELEQALREVVASAAPHFKLAAESVVRASGLPCEVDLRPAGQRVCLDDLVSGGPRPVSGSKPIRPEASRLALYLAVARERRPDLAAIADLMRRPALQGAVLDLELSSFRLDARHRRALQDFLKGLISHAARAGVHDAPLILLSDGVVQQLKAWSTTSNGLRLEARLSAPTRAPAAMLDMLCQALFGSTGRTDSEDAEVDLTAAWPDLDLAFLGRLAAVSATKARLDTRRKAGSAGEAPARGHPRPARR